MKRETVARTESSASLSKSPMQNNGTVCWKFKQGVRPPPGYVGQGDEPATAKIQSLRSQSNAAPQPAKSTTIRQSGCLQSPFDGGDCQNLESSSRSLPNNASGCSKLPPNVVPQLPSNVANQQRPRFMNTFAPVTSTDANKCQTGPSSPGCCCQSQPKGGQWSEGWTASTGCRNSGQGGKLVPGCPSRFVGSRSDSTSQQTNNDCDRSSASSAGPKPSVFCPNSVKSGFGVKSSNFSMHLKPGPACKQPSNTGQIAASCAKTVSPVSSGGNPTSGPTAKPMSKGAGGGLPTGVNSALNSQKSTNSAQKIEVIARPVFYNDSRRQTGGASASKKGQKFTLSSAGNAAASPSAAVVKVLSLHTNSGVTKTKLGVKRMPTALVTQQVESVRAELRAVGKKSESKKYVSADDVIEVFDEDFTPTKCESSNQTIEIFDEPSAPSSSTPSLRETQPEDMETSDAVTEVSASFLRRSLQLKLLLVTTTYSSRKMVLFVYLYCYLCYFRHFVISFSVYIIWYHL